MLFSIGTTKSMNVSEGPYKNGTIVYHCLEILTTEACLTIEQTISRFDEAVVKISHSEVVKNCNKSVRCKLFDKEYWQIKQYIENYIFYSHILPRHHSDLDELRRLNV